ncbi:MAG: multiheme c-type cytochrome [bacterium]
MRVLLPGAGHEAHAGHARGAGGALALVGVRYGPVGWDWFIADRAVSAATGRATTSSWPSGWAAPTSAPAVRCESCHGDRHDAIFAAGGDVSSKVCAECHEAEYSEFSRSGHPEAEVAATTNARFIAAPEAMQRSGCMTCHAIGRTFPDGGKGAATTATRGTASRLRRPGSRPPARSATSARITRRWRRGGSKHGLVYQAMQDAESAPTCVSCHMGGAAGHDTTRNLTLGHIASGRCWRARRRPSRCG